MVHKQPKHVFAGILPKSTLPSPETPLPVSGGSEKCRVTALQLSLGPFLPEHVSLFTLLAGGMCPFRHISGEKTVVCKHWLRGLCKKGDQCEFLHEYDMTKMPECYFYSKFGKACGILGGFAKSQAPGAQVAAQGHCISLFLSSFQYLGRAGQPELVLQQGGVSILCNNFMSLWHFGVWSTFGTLSEQSQ